MTLLLRCVSAGIEQRCVVRGIALWSLLSCRLPANLNSRGSSVAPTWAHLCWPGSRSVHGSIHSCDQRLKQAARSLPGESVSRGFAGRGALEGYPSHYTSLDRTTLPLRPRLHYIKHTVHWLYCSGCWFHLGSAYLHISMSPPREGTCTVSQNVPSGLTVSIPCIEPVLIKLLFPLVLESKDLYPSKRMILKTKKLKVVPGEGTADDLAGL